jgi:ubiquitin C-terminal hydrolase
LKYLIVLPLLYNYIDAFDNLFQQDAHEFLNYLLNTCADILKAEMKELKELKRIDEQNRLNESLTRINTKTHKNLHNKLITNNGTNHHVNQSNGASSSSSIVNNNNKNATSTNQSTGNNNSQNNQKTHQSNGVGVGGGGNNSSKSGSNKSLTSENSLNSNSKNSHNNSPHTHDTDDLNKINLIDASSSCGNGEAEKREELTWIHELFQGILVNETKCLNCETSSSKEENFLDLSVDVEQNTSISHCLQEFSNMEMLCGECKYYCENCCSKQEAEKRSDFFF